MGQDIDAGHDSNSDSNTTFKSRCPHKIIVTRGMASSL